MRFIIALFLVLQAQVTSAQTESCKVEDSRSYMTLDILSIEGVTTCPSGDIYLRVYDGKGADRKFVGTATALINGYTFTATIVGAEEPQDLDFEYVIEP